MHYAFWSACRTSASALEPSLFGVLEQDTYRSTPKRGHGLPQNHAERHGLPPAHRVWPSVSHAVPHPNTARLSLPWVRLLDPRRVLVGCELCLATPCQEGHQGLHATPTPLEAPRPTSTQPHPSVLLGPLPPFWAGEAGGERRPWLLRPPEPQPPQAPKRAVGRERSSTARPQTLPR